MFREGRSQGGRRPVRGLGGHGLDPPGTKAANNKTTQNHPNPGPNPRSVPIQIQGAQEPGSRPGPPKALKTQGTTTKPQNQPQRTAASETERGLGLPSGGGWSFGRKSGPAGTRREARAEPPRLARRAGRAKRPCGRALAGQKPGRSGAILPPGTPTPAIFPSTTPFLPSFGPDDRPFLGLPPPAPPSRRLPPHFFAIRLTPVVLPPQTPPSPERSPSSASAVPVCACGCSWFRVL